MAVLQKRMQRSAVPPPLASRPCWWGDQAMAFTAAAWSPKRKMGEFECWFQMNNWLSLPPLAISRSSGDHFKPHTCMHSTGANRIANERESWSTYTKNALNLGRSGWAADRCGLAMDMTWNSGRARHSTADQRGKHRTCGADPDSCARQGVCPSENS